MIVQLYRRTGDVYTEVIIDEKSIHSKRFMGEDGISLEIASALPIDFKIDDYILHEGKTYVLNTIPRLIKKSSNRYQYTALFESFKFELGKVQYLIFTDDPVNPAPLASFHLTGTAELLIDQVVVNMNRVDDLGRWGIEGTIPSTPHQTIFFEGDTCLSALLKICEEFGLEFVVTGRKITVGYEIGVVHNDRILKYGNGNGLYEIERVSVSSKEVITRLYAFGSSKNIPADYRNYSPRLKLSNDFVEANVDKYGIIEHTEIFEDIYPTRKGSVTWVDSVNFLKFRDSAIDFDLNSTLLAGVSAKVHFVSGILAGYSMELSQYNHSLKEFTLLVNKDEKDFEVPSASIKPEVGDQYVLLDIKMPQSYIDQAELELTARAQAFIDKYSSPQVEYRIMFDPIYLKSLPMEINPGDKIYVGDEEISLKQSVRVMGISYPLVFPERLEINIAEEDTPSTEKLIYREQQKLAAVVSTANAKYASLSLLQKQVRDLVGTVGSHNHDDLYYSKSYIDTNFASALHYHSEYLTEGYANTLYASLGHNHNSLYYTKSELNTSGVASIVHWDKVFNRPTTLGGYGINNAFSKTESDARYAIFSHNHDGDYATASHTHTFASLTSKPTTLSGYGITDAASSTHTHTFASLTSKPTTLSGYGITDAAAASHTHTFASITSKPTTLSGYGITDALTEAQGNILYALVAHNHSGVYAPASHTHGTADISDLSSYASFTNYYTKTVADARYAAFVHNHDGDYASASHNHDSTYLKLAGGTLTGKLTLNNSTSIAPINIPRNGTTNPTTTVSGDLWYRSNNLYYNDEGTVRAVAHTGSWAAMSVAEGQTATATTSRFVRADYLKQIIEYHGDNKYSLLGHTHSDYLTESMANTLYALVAHNHSGTYAPASHSHTTSNITDLSSYASFSNYYTKTVADGRYASFTHNHDGDYASASHTHTFASLTSRPTTLSGYGITDASLSTHTHTFSSITSKPTTLAGYGITDAAQATHTHTYQNINSNTSNNIAGNVDNADLWGNGVSITMVDNNNATYPYGWGTVATFKRYSYRMFQLYAPHQGNRLWLRTMYQTNPTTWTEIITNDNLTKSKIEGLLTGDILTHTHSQYLTEANANNLYSLVGHNHTGVYATASHTHGTADISDLSSYASFSNYYTKTVADARYAAFAHNHDGDYATASHNHTFASLTSKPTTLSGYGITDAATSTHTHTFSSITSKPTTLSGYGITDALPRTADITSTSSSITISSTNQGTYNGKILYTSSSSSITITLDTSVSTGFQLTVIRYGTGDVVFAAQGTGGVIRSGLNKNKIKEQYEGATLVKLNSTEFILMGALKT
ncbi:MAG: hypothetical protein RBT74_10890 [Tenuifilaceae bacterium]|jgi:hypothetical protein|nr:hypothetical protein [Tenuifilaceae bacterium]